MNVDTYILKLESQAQALPQFLNRAMAQEINTLVSGVKQDVREKGIAGKSYSRPYAAVRKKTGRQTAVVDLTFTNRMLNNTQIRGIEDSGQLLLTATVGPSQEGEKDKFSANQKRYGNFMKPSEARRNSFVENINQKLKRFFS